MQSRDYERALAWRVERLDRLSGEYNRALDRLAELDPDGSSLERLFYARTYRRMLQLYTEWCALMREIDQLARSQRERRSEAE